MSEPLSDERLAGIRDREQRATPGPWGVAHRFDIALDVEETEPGCYSFSVSLASVMVDADREDDLHYLKGAQLKRKVASAEDDALFIAHARQDVRDLLAEVERLRAERDRARQTWASETRRADLLEAQLKKVRDELAEFRGMNAMTEANFESYVECAIEEKGNLRERAELAEAEAERLREQLDRTATGAAE